MTPVALTYLILGLATLFWPVATVLFKRRVLDAQWLSMTALLTMSLSVIIYSTFFNTFLKGEYLLVCIFMVLSMVTPPLIQAFVTLLTNPRGLPIRARILILPAVIVTLLMGLSVVIGGADMYRLWIQRGAEGIANRFFANSWRYNLIVAIHYYLYWFVIIAEVTYVAYYCIRHVTRFNRQLGEYYTVDRVRHADLKMIYFTVAANCICVGISYIFFPFNVARPLVLLIPGCLIQGIIMFLIGYYSYRLPVGAEVLSERVRLAPRRSNRDMVNLGRQITDYIERQSACFNPDLSVFMLADRFRVSQDEVIDAIHRLHGISFGEYIDGLRIEHSLSKLNSKVLDDPAELDQLAHSCGYLTSEDYRHSFERVMQTTMEKWADQ
jgi:AraC-like DNA-binding protein